ncbi:class I SAM-dependent methyltransferase [Gracilibacillus caseinilyticus]|uniref:Class I SAM-dependent methyltransferase n=1 Tax=Gracilibacillus caseinilyticus TaxID=2932256 RepID=A0ABY4EYN8_9BACI|nr:class I SAM-dependent methyltransferase [Gracilibacillus caseinilyticus]UOQ49017.1 class I SAM-dependent methyltransferase [Gracilibacillus caseinilyticus]
MSANRLHAGTPPNFHHILKVFSKTTSNYLSIEAIGKGRWYVMDQQSLINKFNKQAHKYSKRRLHDQLYQFRNKIFPEAYGKVIEVGIGTGLNFPFYANDIELTGVDFSPEMLKIANDTAHEYPFSTKLIEGDIESVHFDENTFDTVVSSLTLCAYRDPVFVLDKFKKWCKPDGKILMMEHGISSKKSVALLQHTIDPLALKILGCHQNRNIIKLMKQAELKVIKKEQYFAGYLSLIWAAP